MLKNKFNAVFDKPYNKPKPEFTAKIRSGERRTYFIDVQKSKMDDYYLVLTESTKKPNSDQVFRNKIHIYKEDLNKFINEMGKAADFLKNNLMPDYDFDRSSKQNTESSDNSEETL